MSEKQELIRKDYFAPEGGHPLSGFRESYADLATQLVDLAHEEKGSKR